MAGPQLSSKHLSKQAKRVIKSIVKRLINIVNKIYLNINNVSYGKNLKINGFIKIKNHGRIVIGDDVTINSGFYINPIGGYSRTMLNTYKGSEIIIGNGVGVSNSIIVAKKKIVIGEKTLIGGGSLIFDSDFHSLDWKIRNTQHDESREKEVVIGRHVFVGAHAILTKGSVVEDMGIVPAGFHGRYPPINHGKNKYK